MKKTYTFVIFLLLAFLGCTPSNEAIQKAIIQTQTAQSTPTHTHVPTRKPLPTNTPRPKFIYESGMCFTFQIKEGGPKENNCTSFYKETFFL